MTSHTDEDAIFMGNSVDLIVEGYLRRVEDGLMDWYYHVDVTNVKIEEGPLDSNEHEYDRKVLYQAQRKWQGKVTEFGEDNIRDIEEL